MKKHIYQILPALLLGLLFTACADNDYTQLDKGSNELAMTIDQSAEVLNELNHAAEAVTINWTTGHNFRTGNRITYLLEMTAGEKTYAAIDHQTQVYQWSANQEQLNDILLNQLGIRAGQQTTVNARLTAIVEGMDERQTATASFSATPYAPVTTTLYLVGDATPNGWSADNATEMKRTDNGIFTWQGNLKAGELKFLTTPGQWLPSYNNDGNGGLVLRTSDDEPDVKFIITEDHFYQVKVNLLTSEVTMTQMEGEVPAYDNLYFVGDATGWGFVKMNKDPLDAFLFRYAHHFTAAEKGEFKFGTSEGSWENMYKATSAGAPYTQTTMELIAGYDPDNKWYLQESETDKAYKICVDIRTGKERMMMHEFKPYEMIYLVGDATPAGWDIGGATPMKATDSPYIFTWTGSLTTGEVKFTCDRQSDWNGAWFMNSKGNDVAPTGEVEQMLFIDKSNADFKAQYLEINVGDIDQKWQIQSAGTYTITLNQLEETVSIVKN